MAGTFKKVEREIRRAEKREGKARKKEAKREGAKDLSPPAASDEILTRSPGRSEATGSRVRS